MHPGRFQFQTILSMTPPTRKLFSRRRVKASQSVANVNSFVPEEPQSCSKCKPLESSLHGAAIKSLYVWKKNLAGCQEHLSVPQQEGLCVGGGGGGGGGRPHGVVSMKCFHCCNSKQHGLHSHTRLWSVC